MKIHVVTDHSALLQIDKMSVDNQLFVATAALHVFSHRSSMFRPLHSHVSPTTSITIISSRSVDNQSNF